MPSTPKVLLVGGLDCAQSLWCIRKGFERAGCRVDYVPSLARVDGGKGLRQDIRSVLNAHLTQRPDLIFWWQPQNGVPRKFLQRLVRAKRRPQLVMQSLDDPFVLDLHYSKGFELFDFAVTCCAGSFKWYESHGVHPILGYPPVDRDLHKPTEDAEWLCDMSFAATNIYPRRNYPHVLATRKEMVEAVSGLGTILLYGYRRGFRYDWSALDDAQLPKATTFKGWINYEQHPDLFSRSRINLCSHVRPDGDRYLNERVTTCMASGGFLLTDRVAGIESFFGDGQHLALWGSLDELKDKVQYYLAHAPERVRIAAAGREVAMKAFDNETLAQTVLCTVLK